MGAADHLSVRTVVAGCDHPPPDRAVRAVGSTEVTLVAGLRVGPGCRRTGRGGPGVPGSVSPPATITSGPPGARIALM